MLVTFASVMKDTNSIDFLPILMPCVLSGVHNVTIHNIRDMNWFKFLYM